MICTTRDQGMDWLKLLFYYENKSNDKLKTSAIKTIKVVSIFK